MYMVAHLVNWGVVVHTNGMHTSWDGDHTFSMYFIHLEVHTKGMNTAWDDHHTIRVCISHLGFCSVVPCV